MTLLRDLIDIPEKVTPGDLVMGLASGINAVDRTIDDYVVTSQLVSALADAPGLVAASAHDGQSRAAYLHGSSGRARATSRGCAAHVAKLHPGAPEAPVCIDREIRENVVQLLRAQTRPNRKWIKPGQMGPLPAQARPPC